MEAVDLSPSTAPIDTLPDLLLAKIFSFLPFKDRYLTSLVSPKWSAASRVPWSDVTSIRLRTDPPAKATIPPAMVNVILELCPKVEVISASGQTVILTSDAAMSSSANVVSMCLWNVMFEAPPALGAAQPPSSATPLLTNYFKRFPNLEDLALRNTRPFFSMQNGGNAPGKLVLPLVFPATTAMSLRRLILVNYPLGDGHLIGVALRETLNLECLYMAGNPRLDYCLDGLPQLRELCLESYEYNNTLAVLAAGVACGKFPRLEALAYTSSLQVDPISIGLLITAQIPLHILVIAGYDRPLALERTEQKLTGNVEAVVIPARPVYYSADQLPFPMLQIFVGGDFTKNVRFRRPANANVAQFSAIDCPVPEFLAKPAVAEVFKDVWVTKIIVDDPPFGISSWGSPDEGAFFHSTGPLLFG